MSCRGLVMVLAWWFWGGAVLAQDIQRGTLKKLDVEQRRVVVTVDGRERTFTLTEQTQVLGATGKDLAERLRDFKEGAEIFFKPGRGDERETLLGIKLVDGSGMSKAGPPRRGTIRRVDLDRRAITIAVEGQDCEFAVTDQTQFRGVEGKDLGERIKGLTAGTEVQFLATTRDGQDVLLGLMTGRAGGGSGVRVSPDTSRLKPLTELGQQKYQGFAGGLYPGGQNDRPKAHEEAGLKLARQVQPLDADGQPDPAGKVVLLSIGMSNTSQASQGFQQWLADDRETNPRLVFVNGAQGGMTAAAIQDPDDHGRGATYWSTVDQRLQQAGVSRTQVQAVWIKQADAGPTQGFPKYAQQLQAELVRIVQLLPSRFPNCRLAYLSSRTYGGYATTRLNPEPYAYESGFSVKWLIEQQLRGEPELNFDLARGPVKSPWLSWGPYLWANGETPRADGFSYAVTDFGGDGTHPSASGQRKVGKLLLDFLQTDTTTRPWFRQP
jgi:hypothetical protein